MKKIIVATALLSLATAGSALAFHDGGVAYCDGCHTMHNSYQGTKMTVNALTPVTQGNKMLLKGSDPSSTCLNCHSGATQSSYHVATYPNPAAGVAPANYTPGGDFAWLTKGYTWTNPRNGSNIAERHGHNIVAGDFTGYVVDSKLSTAPGGTYPAASLACSSCHDPHGKYRMLQDGTIALPAKGSATLPIGQSGSYGALADTNEAVGVYRLLAGVGYQPVSLTGSYAFANPSPVAVANSNYNVTEGVNPNRVAYGNGMSEWCANCHTNIHNDTYPTNLRHPAGNTAAMSATVLGNYNAYKKSGDLTNTQANAYDTLVPFELQLTGSSADKTTLLTYAAGGTNQAAGPVTGNNVMCLSCHRAHATGFQSMSRWNNNGEFLTIAGAWPGTNLTGDAAAGTYNQGMTQTEYTAAMYGKSASNYAYAQRSLCNKCHAKD